MLCDSRGVPVICILVLDIACFAITVATRECWSLQSKATSINQARLNPEFLSLLGKRILVGEVGGVRLREGERVFVRVIGSYRELSEVAKTEIWRSRVSTLRIWKAEVDVICCSRSTRLKLKTQTIISVSCQKKDESVSFFLRRVPQVAKFAVCTEKCGS